MPKWKPVTIEELDALAEANDIVGLMKRAISHWAFLPMDEFDNDTPLNQLRPYFGQISKIGMMVGLRDYGPGFKLDCDEDVLILNTVNQFVDFVLREQ